MDKLVEQYDANGDGVLSIEPDLKADDPVYGGDGPQRFGNAVAGLREVLGRAGIAEA